VDRLLNKIENASQRYFHDFVHQNANQAEYLLLYPPPIRPSHSHSHHTLPSPSPILLRPLYPTTPTPDPAQATPISAKRFPVPPLRLLLRPAELVAPEPIGCLLVKRQEGGELLWGVIVETEAYSQEEPACHGYRRRHPRRDG